MVERILVVAAHPDDEVLGCGGTLARLAREGQDTYVGILGEGLTSRLADPRDIDPALIDELHAKGREAARRLGAKDFFSHRFPDNRFDTVAFLDVVKVVEGWIERVRPTAVYTHHAGDLNVDHRTAHQAVLTATRPVPGQTVRDVYSFEVASSTEWAFGQLPVFRPSVFVDVEATLDAKIEALQLYDGEVRRFPHPRSPDALRAAARKWGSVAGVAAAEPFELIRSLR